MKRAYLLLAIGSLMTLASRVLGVVREMAYSYFFGTSTLLSDFRFAFQIPNLFRRLLGEGALTAAFIPIFKEKEKRDGDAAMWHAANAVISAVFDAPDVTGRAHAFTQLFEPLTR